MNKIHSILSVEYNEVKKDPLFAHILAIHENFLNYSARLIYIMMCRQLVNEKKHDMWCVFRREVI